MASEEEETNTNCTAEGEEQTPSDIPTDPSVKEETINPNESNGGSSPASTTTAKSAEEDDLESGYKSDGTHKENPPPDCDSDDEGGPINFFSKDFEVMQIMNKLYDVLRDVTLDDIHLPTLVTCGDQSAGKTSVLEGIVRQEFLPKGEEIQTRCPIEIQLCHTKDDEEPHAEILEEDDKTWVVYRNINRVKKAIQERTNKIKVECPAGVTDKRIVVRIFSTDVMDLTLVDLPGFLNVNTVDQSEDIISKIEQVCRKEISNPNSIILAVTPANNNIGTSRALQEALKVDLARERTMGIITKLDLMDKGTNCEDVLKGNKLNLKLGFVGVMNRNFDDTRKNRSIEDKLIEEKHFLEEHYPNIAYQHGSDFLTKKLSYLLLAKIYETLPTVKGNIERCILQCKKRLEGFGTVVDPADRKFMFINYINKFIQNYSAQFEGCKRNMEIGKMNASSRIQIAYRNLLLQNNFDVCEGITDQHIDNAIVNSQGLHNIVSDEIEDAFHHFAQLSLVHLRQPVVDCAQLVYDEMIGAINSSSDAEADKYPKLNKNIARVVSDVINESFQKCKEYLENYLHAEESFVYMAGPDFKQKMMTPRNNPGVEEESSEQDPKVKNREGVRVMVVNYFNYVKNSVRDHCPKAISKLLVYDTLEIVKNELVYRLYTDEYVDELMKESPAVQKARAMAMERLQKYTNAKDIINEILKGVQL